MIRARFPCIRLAVAGEESQGPFQVSKATARLICMYRGNGTQYGIAADGADTRSVHTVLTGSPIILRGTGWPEIPLSGLLHRSPPAQDPTEARLVLTLDPVLDPADENRCQYVH